MNLARVEHYFSRFLSAMELRSRQGSAMLDLAPGHSVVLSPNLKFAGTVNVDETTYGFADKVYDRAQLIELPLRREDVAKHLEGRPYADDRARGRRRAARPVALRVPGAGRDRPVRARAPRSSGPRGRSRWTRSSCRRSCPGSVAPTATWTRASRPSSARWATGLPAVAREGAGDALRSSRAMASPASEPAVGPDSSACARRCGARTANPASRRCSPACSERIARYLIRRERWTQGDLARHPSLAN